jgi:exo-beta-1,3-glucanase (GH17 family)
MRPQMAFLILVVVLFRAASGQVAPSEPAEGVINDIRWISYAPTNYYPAETPPVMPDQSSIRADLEVIRRAGFTGLITYGSAVEGLPEMARRTGFKTLLIGIWNPLDTREVKKAIDASRRNPGLIGGVIVGNEGLSRGDYTIEQVCNVMSDVRKSTGKPVTSTEPVDVLLSETRLGRCSSFVTVNAHPYFSGKKLPDAAVHWTLEAWEAVRREFPNKPALFKEVGLPTGGDPDLSEDAQRQYYERLALTPVRFAYFEAFDATPRFKHGLVEQFWGLWRSDRTPKSIVAALPWRMTFK